MTTAETIYDTIKAGKQVVPGLNIHGYEILPSDAARSLFEASGSLSDYTKFKYSFNQLELDKYLGSQGKNYRKRTHAVYSAADKISLLPSEPHYQETVNNSLFGGIKRVIAPIAPEVATGPSMMAILTALRKVFENGSENQVWKIEVHQFRIEATAAQVGQPTPEGLHNDGRDYVAIMLVHRENIAGGITTIHDTDGKQLRSHTLMEPLETVLLNDHDVMHQVSPVFPVDTNQVSYRDVLVITFQHVR